VAAGEVERRSEEALSARDDAHSYRTLDIKMAALTVSTAALAPVVARASVSRRCVPRRAPRARRFPAPRERRETNRSQSLSPLSGRIAGETRGRTGADRAGADRRPSPSSMRSTPRALARIDRIERDDVRAAGRGAAARARVASRFAAFQGLNG
jgi:hypothetical protein